MRISIRTLFSFIMILIFIGVKSQVSFMPVQTLLSGSLPQALTVGDINNDGLSDVVIVTTHHSNITQYKNRIFIFYQNYMHELDTPVSFFYTDTNRNMGSVFISTDDLNNDNLNDITISIDDSIIILFQDSRGLFNNRLAMYSGNDIDDIKTADLNNDGLSDIAISHWNEDSIRVFYQVQNGFVSKGYRRNPPNGWSEIDIGDINNDGLNDVVHMSGQLAGRIMFFIQNQIGELIVPSQVYLPFNFTQWNNNLNSFGGIAIGDLNNDGINDIISSKNKQMPDSKILIWFFNNQTGNFTSHIEYDAYHSPEELKITDLNCDGKNEIIVRNEYDVNISIYEQDNLGSYNNGYNLYQGLSSNYGDQALCVADINNDGKRDIVGVSQGLSFLINSSPTGNLLSTHTYSICDTTENIYTTTVSDTLIIQILDTIDNDVIITSLTYRISYAFKMSDNYCTRITTKTGCGLTIVPDTVNYVISDTLSTNIDSILLFTTIDTISYNHVNYLDLLNNSKLFPNPTNKEIVFFSSMADNIADIEIIDIMGITHKANFSRGKNQLLIDVRNLLPGNFYLKLITKDNQVVINRFNISL